MIALPTWRSLLATEKPLILPGAYDCVSARLIRNAGFRACLVGGFSVVGSRYGLPDLGLTALGDMVPAVRDIVGACELPVLVDADDGYGDVKNVTHTVRTYERTGAAALFLEDQVAPKRCGHFGGKDVVPVAVMEAKIRAAVAAREDREFFLIARTDARAVHGLDEALKRAERYLLAGADGLFIEAPRSVAELERIGAAFDVPQFCNMLVGGETPIVKSRDLHAMGFQMIVHGTTLLMRAAHAVQETLRAIGEDRLDVADGLMTLAQFQDVVEFEKWAALEH